MAMLRLTIIAAAASLLVACGGSDDDRGPDRGAAIDPPQQIGATVTAAQIDAMTQASKLQPLTGKAQCDVKVMAINYATLGVKPHEGANASGVMLVPTGALGSPCATAAAPLVAYSRGTDINKSRTLANPQDGETLMLMAFFASQGYAVVATDYLGYAKSTYSFHPYLHADSEATSVIDSVRLARRVANAVGVKLSGKVMFTGYSQGGHASMASQRSAERDYGSEFNVVAGAHLAGPYNLAGAMKVPQAIAGYQIFVPFIITAWQKVYGNIYTDPTQVFKPPYAAGISNLLPSPGASATSLITGGLLPAGTPDQARDALMQPAFLQSMLTDDKAPINADAVKNTLFDWKPKAPVLLCGGSGDPTVVQAVHQIPMMANFMANGVTNFTSVDVDDAIAATFGPVPTDPTSAAYATYYGNYHGTYEPPFCLAAARKLFDSVR